MALNFTGARAYVHRVMRKDMSKVIVERPRYGSRHGHHTLGRARVIEDDDGEPLRVRVKPTRLNKTKTLNEHLGPLKRYLDSQVGRPWNKVYSEISENLKSTNTVQQHVRDHLKDFVAIKTAMKDGKVVELDRYGGIRPIGSGYSRFYVHPKTGLLKRNPDWRTWGSKWKAAKAAHAVERAKRMRIVSSYVQLHLFEEVWWEVTLKDVPQHADYADVVVSAQLTTMPTDDLYGRPGVYAARKRVLSRKEKKALDLL